VTDDRHMTDHATIAMEKLVAICKITPLQVILPIATYFSTNTCATAISPKTEVKLKLEMGSKPN